MRLYDHPRPYHDETIHWSEMGVALLIGGGLFLVVCLMLVL